MGQEFQREFGLRLPWPLAQLYGQAFNAQNTRGRHDNAFFLFKALIKLAAAIDTAEYAASQARCSAGRHTRKVAD